MAMYGTFNGSVIETDAAYPVGQRFLLIPISNERKVNEQKKTIIEKLYGSVPDSGRSYEEIRRERREQL